MLLRASLLALWHLKLRRVTASACATACRLAADHALSSQGCCEHMVTIRDVCLVHPDHLDARLRCTLRAHTSYTRRRECNICTTRLAAKVRLRLQVSTRRTVTCLVLMRNSGAPVLNSFAPNRRM